jgi:hypothetical protein
MRSVSRVGPNAVTAVLARENPRQESSYGCRYAISYTI